MEKIDGITFDVGAVQCIDRDESDLSVGLIVDLMAEVFYVGSRAGIEDVGEIVDVAGGLEVFDRLGVRGHAEQENEKSQQTELRAHVHRKIVQEEMQAAGIRRRTNSNP